MGIAHVVQVVGDVYLHLVADFLIFLDAGIELHKLVFVFLVKQGAHHAKHALDAFAKGANLLLCLEYRELGGLHDTRCDEVQLEVVLFVLTAGLDNGAHEFLNLRNEPYEDGGVGDIECRVETGKHYRDLGEIGLVAGVGGCHVLVKACQVANEPNKRLEQAQRPDDTYHVVGEVGECCAPGLHVGTHGSDVGGNGSSYVLAQHEHDTLSDAHHASGAQYHGDCHHGCRRLHTQREHTTYHQEEQVAPH